MRSGRSVFTILLIDAGACLCFAGDREGGEDDGEVGLDAVAQPVEHRPGREVGLGHPEGAFDLVESW